jgi:hypothetical protein
MIRAVLTWGVLVSLIYSCCFQAFAGDEASGNQALVFPESSVLKITDGLRDKHQSISALREYFTGAFRKDERDEILRRLAQRFLEIEEKLNEQTKLKEALQDKSQGQDVYRKDSSLEQAQMAQADLEKIIFEALRIVEFVPEVKQDEFVSPGKLIFFHLGIWFWTIGALHSHLPKGIVLSSAMIAYIIQLKRFDMHVSKEGEAYDFNRDQLPFYAGVKGKRDRISLVQRILKFQSKKIEQVRKRIATKEDEKTFRVAICEAALTGAPATTIDAALEEAATAEAQQYFKSRR